ncbi:MAG: nucleotidyltransferase family protein [Bacteroidia bacterium]
MKTDVIILNSGKSQRMGIPKMLLPFSKKITFIEHLIDVYSQINSDVYMVISKENFKLINACNKKFASKNIRYIINHHQASEKIFSVLLGLRESKNEGIFIQNIDMPFVETALLKQMMELCREESYVKPVFNGKGGHPVLLHCSLKNRIIKMCEKNSDTTLKDVLSQFSKIKLPYYSDKILANINSPEDYRKYFNNNFNRAEQCIIQN